MPFNPDNPNRNRNFVILVMSATIAFAIIMGCYVTLSIAGKDTDSYLRFLTLLVVTLVPSALAAFRANTAATKTHEVSDKVDLVVEQTNGGMDKRIEDGVRKVLTESGQPPLEDKHKES